MLSLASKLLNLAVSSQDCTRNDLRRSKIQKFSEGGPPRPPYVTRFARLPCFLVGALRAQLRRHDFIAQSALHLTKLKLLPTGLMMKLMCMHSENAREQDVFAPIITITQAGNESLCVLILKVRHPANEPGFRVWG